MNIRRAGIEDLGAAAEMFNLYRIFQKQQSDKEGAEDYLKERLEKEESVIFLAYDEENRVEGIAQLYPLFSSVSMKRIWLLNDLYIKEEARNKGYGKKLIEEVIRFAKDTGAGGVSLETCDDNYGAQRLYEGIGFKKETNYFYHLSL
ncbi:GNAT family N-acetyltransferase [Aciduricibacillus chroicocephali]|uniref:GNAT family N-acetyltransferase n=1 Tax=Aciduricibacillus chroicocephali TaxID=3054939 RepID=A0ABY9KX62_9BACI|nr:GNAT family N-acetyltransferase [Bacillaceae bacterium 44XB]